MRLRNAKFYCKMLFKNATCLHQLLVFLMIQYVTLMINSPLLQAFTIALFFLYTKALNGHDDLQKRKVKANY